MNKENHKIDADDRKVFEVLNARRYTIDYFQREYSWEQKHIAQLVTDLTETFLGAYTTGDQRTAVANYNNYYLGPFVVSERDGAKSIIDGQQRLTSLTLFLIFLNNLQKETGGKESIEPLIFSEQYGEKSFNIQVEERKACLEKLFQTGSYDVQPDDDESTRNMVSRYNDIIEAFPEEIKGNAFPYFLDWLKYNVVLVEITAYSDDNAYAIFESMNDRGLNLNSTEMLKGYILSRFALPKDREQANAFWKEKIQELHGHGKDEDQKFFQAWMRSQYADTIRQGKAGASNEDFEKIGTRFHSWFRDNLGKVGLNASSSANFSTFVHRDMKFYLRAYLDILAAQKEERPQWEHVFYHKQFGIADSLSYPLLLAALQSTDSPETVREKINTVARYMETFAVRRAVNSRRFAASSIRYTMYSLVKEIRGMGLDALKTVLGKKLSGMDEKWDGLANFRLNGTNKSFVKFLLSRVTGFIEQETGASTSFSNYFSNTKAKAYEIEHIWAGKFGEHRDEFSQVHEFEDYRNRIGALLLLPQGTNQSYGAKPYAEKVEHYLKENLLAKSLHPKAYENNPNFVKMVESLGLGFKAHLTFARVDIDERQSLIQRICGAIWNGSDAP